MRRLIEACLLTAAACAVLLPLAFLMSQAEAQRSTAPQPPQLFFTQDPVDGCHWIVFAFPNGDMEVFPRPLPCEPPEEYESETESPV